MNRITMNWNYSKFTVYNLSHIYNDVYYILCWLLCFSTCSSLPSKNYFSINGLINEYLAVTYKSHFRVVILAMKQVNGLNKRNANSGFIVNVLESLSNGIR